MYQLIDLLCIRVYCPFAPKKLRSITENGGRDVQEMDSIFSFS